MMGIYITQNTMNGRVYVGSSQNLTQRLGQRIVAHLNKAMATDVLLYGTDAFESMVVEEVMDVRLLEQREQVWIDFLMAHCPEKVYNFEKKVKMWG